MVIYHYPPIGEILMEILHVFIIKNYPIWRVMVNYHISRVMENRYYPYMVIIRFFLSRYQLMLYIFTRRRNIFSTFLEFMGGLLTTSKLIFLHYKYVIAIHPNVGMSIYIEYSNLLFYRGINGFVLSYVFRTHITMFILCHANNVLSYDVWIHKTIFSLKCTTIIF